METQNSTPTLRDSGDARREPFTARAARGLALAGFVMYAMAAPHSIAGAWMGLSVVVVGWLTRSLAARDLGIRRTPLDLPLWLLFFWTILSAIFSAEPRVSAGKLVSVSTFLVFYLTRSMLTRRTAVVTAVVLIASGTAGVLWSVGEVAVGRGVVVSELRPGSPLRGATPLAEGDAVWRVGGERVNSVDEIDDIIRRTPAGSRLSLSVIARGEHAEWPGVVVTDEMKHAPSPSGIVGGGRTRRFRASGWTRHYETYSEVLQIIAQFALGFALANVLRGAARRAPALAFAAFALLGIGIALTAMRTTLVAFVVGAAVVSMRAAARARARLFVASVIVCALCLGALVVWRTRGEGALALSDPSSALRARVAEAALGRVSTHPFLGHGMDAAHRHWREWGFPGDDLLHTHSTPLQIAFDRGLPALLFWLWLMAALWLAATRAERIWRTSDDAAVHGLALGATGALAGFLASSVVNYNFGDAEVALLLWWLAGACVVSGER